MPRVLRNKKSPVDNTFFRGKSVPQTEKNIQVLLVEDVEADALLLVHELRKAGFEVENRIVDSAESLLAIHDELLDKEQIAE